MRRAKELPNKRMQLTKLSAAWLPEWTCRLMPAPARSDAGTASQLIRRVRPSKGKMDESWRTLTPEQQAELEAFMPARGWRIVASRELPSVFPASFRSRIDSALVIATPTSTGGTYLITNALRVDFKDRALDQEPFGLIVHSSGADSSGVFLHHGAWSGRTVYPPASFWLEVSSSGVGDYFLAAPPSGQREGTLEELPSSHRAAFATIIKVIRARVDSGSEGPA
jgi:hypothetical protein